jgi:hypothetical protein
VAIARALATQPSVLLMDEPFAALDAQTRDMLHDELERIWKETGCTIIFVTHNVREAVRLGSRVILMTYRPGTIRSQLDIVLPRPRRMDDPRVALLAREVLDELREEINKAVASEFDHVPRSSTGAFWGPGSCLPMQRYGLLIYFPRRSACGSHCMTALPITASGLRSASACGA